MSASIFPGRRRSRCSGSMRGEEGCVRQAHGAQRGGVGKLMTRNHSMVEGSVVWVHRGLPLLALALFRFFQDFFSTFSTF